VKMLRENHTQKFCGTTLLVAATLLSGCGGLQSVVNPAGPQSNHISKLWWLMFYVSAAVFVVVIIFLFLALASGRKRNALARKPGDYAPPDVTPPPEGERKRRNIVVSATVLTVVILFVFLMESFFVGRGLTSELSNKQGVSIEVTGHQWWWEVRYMNVDASSIFTTANEIHMPVGVPVTLTLKANDVIHSFWVPNLHGKKDLIPGKLSTIWLQADRAGVFRGQCAEYCGHQHAHMALWVIAEPAQQFNTWLQMQIQPAVAPANESQKRGQQVFLSSSCVMCHSISGTPAGSNIGPNLTHLAGRNTIAAATLENTRDHLSQWVTDSQQVKPGNRMPPNALSPEDLQALLDYLQSLK